MTILPAVILFQMLSSSLMFVYFECSVFDIIQDDSLCLMHHLHHVAATLVEKLSDTVVDEVLGKVLRVGFLSAGLAVSCWLHEWNISCPHIR